MTHSIDTPVLVEDYKTLSLNEIAKLRGMSPATVWDRLKGAGVKMRPQGDRFDLRRRV